MTSFPLRTALVNPPDVFANGYEEENAIPPLGLGYIAAVLRGAGFPVDQFDLAACYPLDPEHLDSAGLFDYDVYGLTAYTKSFLAALETARLIRARNPNAIIVFGGPHASPCAHQILAEYSEIDLVVRGEGEGPMVDLLRHLTDGSVPIEEVANLTWREEGLSARTDGRSTPLSAQIHSNQKDYSAPSLDELPFPARDFVIEPPRTSLLYRKDGSVVEEVHICSSRGCPKRCTFCSIIVASPNYRVRSPASLMAEIKSLRATRDFGHVHFVDANFAVSVKRTEDFSNRLCAWDQNVTWSGTASADFILRHEEVLPEIGKRNCTQLEIGIESGSEAQLARFNKRTRVDQNADAIALLWRSGISVGLDFIMFDPESTLAEVRENLEFLRDADLFGTSPPDCLFNAMRLYAGTPARAAYLKKLGLADHHLSNIECTIHDPLTAAFADIIGAYFNDYQPILTDALVLLQSKWRTLDEVRYPVYRQQIATLVVECRHEPYHFFEDMLFLAERGHIGADSAVKDFWGHDWHGRLVDLVRRANELLENPPPADEHDSVPLSVECHGGSYIIPRLGLPIRLRKSYWVPAGSPISEANINVGGMQ